MEKTFDVERYRLRYAAGQYWLLDMKQQGIVYCPPLLLNRIGAELWMMIEEGLSVEQMTETLCRRYQVTAQQVQADIQQFYEDLNKQG